jgi:general secretion pathway protein L
MLLLVESAWRWWLAELVSLVPRGWLEWLISPRVTLLLRPEGDAITEIVVMRGDTCLMRQSVVDGSQETPTRLREAIAAATGGKSFDVVGVIPENRTLVRPLALPLAAESHLREAVHYQIERISPFRPDNTLYDIAKMASDRAADEVRLALTVVAGDFVGELEQRGAQLGFRIDRFASEAVGSGVLRTLDFKSKSASRGKVSLETKALFAAAFVLTVSLLIVPIIGKWKEAELLETEIEAVRPKAEQVLKLQAESERIVALRAQVIGLKKAAPPPVAVLAKLSELLDDQTYLFDMRMEGAVVTVSGLSSDASKLAQRLGGIDVFKTVRFSGPVLRDLQTARDRFTLVLEMAVLS